MKKVYAQTGGLRFRKTPSTKNTQNLIKELRKGESMTVFGGPWLSVQVGDTVGWVHADYVQETKNTEYTNLPLGVANLHGDARTKAIRDSIGDMYGGGVNGWELQCTEYVTYRVQEVCEVLINWPVSSGRHGGKWGSIFLKYGTYPVFMTPRVHAAMSFTTGISSSAATNAVGHVAFVEEVYDDQSIKISEANWPRNGIYNERILTKSEWKDKYKAQFVTFV